MIINFKKISNLFMKLYFLLFFFYLFLPLIFVSVAAFNDTSMPTVYPWSGFTLHWLGEFIGHDALMLAIWNSLIIALIVILLSVPIGLAGALFLFSTDKKSKKILYPILVSPILTPGVIVGISTLVMWSYLLEVSGGLFLAAMGQTTFIASMNMLLFMAKLQKFDKNLELAALDLGATPSQQFFRVVLPFLKPTIYITIILSLLQSIQNYNTTLFLIGTDTTITIFIGSMIKFGLSPVLNVLAFVSVLIAIVISLIQAFKKWKSRA